jgi:hypothetical protein
MEPDELLHLIDNLEDERSRARVREGIYVSLLAHVLIFLWILFGPRYILHRPKVISPFDVLKERQQKELTYMSLPPDALKHIRPKNPKALSDKDRVAQSPHPTLDRKTLEQLQAMRPPGPPASRTQPQPAPAAPQETAPPSQAAPPAPKPQASHFRRNWKVSPPHRLPRRNPPRRSPTSTRTSPPERPFVRPHAAPRSRRPGETMAQDGCRNTLA